MGGRHWFRVKRFHAVKQLRISLPETLISIVTTSYDFVITVQPPCSWPVWFKSHTIFLTSRSYKIDSACQLSYSSAFSHSRSATRPLYISHHSCLWKLTERVVKFRLIDYLSRNNLYSIHSNQLQSSIILLKLFHSSLCVHDHIIKAMSHQQVISLVSLF